jgi:hypothetical protein
MAEQERVATFLVAKGLDKTSDGKSVEKRITEGGEK